MKSKWLKLISACLMAFVWCIPQASSDSYLRANYVINVVNYGAAGDGVTNDTAAILKAIKKSAGMANALIVLPNAAGYAVDQTIQIPANVSLEQHAPLIYIGNANQPLLVIGEVGRTTTGKFTGISVTRKLQSGWLESDFAAESVGVRFINVNTSQIEIMEASRFTIGCQFFGIGGGCAYNQVSLGMLKSNYIGLDLNNKSFGGHIGWANENLFLSGRFAIWPGVNSNQPRIGVRITSSDHTYLSNNNNVFLKPSFELKPKDCTGAAMPILIEYGKLNTFDYVRNEGNGQYVAQILNDSEKNRITVTYGSSNADDKSATKNNLSVRPVYKE